jgi:RNA polymerase sigma-70 factor (ECF subfamily)
MKNHHFPDWESHLVMRAQEGEAIAFEMLADLHRHDMRSLAMRILRDADDANDAVQDALVKAFRGLRGFKAGRPVLPWLLRICSNCCFDLLRSRRAPCENIERFEFTLRDESQEIAAGAEAKATGAEVREAVDRLPDRYRDVIMMRHFRHMEVGEIATALDKPEGTVKSWLFRARAMLRAQLQVSLG